MPDGHDFVTTRHPVGGVASEQAQPVPRLRAVTACQRCPAGDACFDYALVAGEREGIWGGTLSGFARAFRLVGSGCFCPVTKEFTVQAPSPPVPVAIHEGYGYTARSTYQARPSYGQCQARRFAARKLVDRQPE